MIGHEGREVFWNIPLPAFEIVLFALTAVALAIIGLWHLSALADVESHGQTGNPPGQYEGKSQNGSSGRIFLQKKVLKDPYPGIMHGFNLFWFFCFDFRSRF